MQYIKGQKLADEIDKRFKISKDIKNAISKVDRELFVPAGFKHLAYKLDALPIGSEQWISSPLMVAKMSEYLLYDGADSVLEIGCGSGYQAAILSKLFRRVFSIERIEKLLFEARDRIKKSNIMNINTKLDDGQNGWSVYAPYDRVLFSASIATIPATILDQLSDGGYVVAPINDGNKQIVTRYQKRGSSYKKEELEECYFVPVLSGVVS